MVHLLRLLRLRLRLLLLLRLVDKKPPLHDGDNESEVGGK